MAPCDIVKCVLSVARQLTRVLGATESHSCKPFRVPIRPPLALPPPSQTFASLEPTNRGDYRLQRKPDPNKMCF